MNNLTTFELTVTPAQIIHNYETIYEQVKQRIADKKTIATLENLQSVKTGVADLVKECNGIADNWKPKKQELERPIKETDQKIKSILELYQVEIKDMRDQVKVFEDAKKKEIHALMLAEMADLRQKHEVDPVYQTSVLIEKDTNLSDLTQGGKLAKNTLIMIENLVNGEKLRQTTVTSRIHAIENACLKANVPMLAQSAYQSWYLREPKDFEDNLSKALAEEIKRQQEAEERQARLKEAKRQQEIDEALAEERAKLAEQQAKLDRKKAEFEAEREQTKAKEFNTGVTSVEHRFKREIEIEENLELPDFDNVERAHDHITADLEDENTETHWNVHAMVQIPDWITFSWDAENELRAEFASHGLNITYLKMTRIEDEPVS